MELSRTTEEQYDRLNRLGFPINETSKHPTPTMAFALKWLREVKKIHVNLWIEDNDREWRFTLEFLDDGDHASDATTELIIYGNYDKAESAGLYFALDYLLKQKT